MNYNKQKKYTTQIAEDARKHCEENNIIEKGKLILELKDLKNILEFFGGKLEKNDQNENSIIKIDDESYDFIIYYALQKVSQSEEKLDKIKILTGLAEIFLGASEIKSNEKHNIDNLAIELCSLQPDAFARAFIMPDQLFIKQMIENTCNGEINVIEMAKAFEIDYMEIIARGNELKLFK